MSKSPMNPPASEDAKQSKPAPDAAAQTKADEAAVAEEAAKAEAAALAEAVKAEEALQAADEAAAISDEASKDAELADAAAQKEGFVDAQAKADAQAAAAKKKPRAKRKPKTVEPARISLDVEGFETVEAKITDRAAGNIFVAFGDRDRLIENIPQERAALRMVKGKIASTDNIAVRTSGLTRTTSVTHAYLVEGKNVLCGSELGAPLVLSAGHQVVFKPGNLTFSRSPAE